MRPLSARSIALVAGISVCVGAYDQVAVGVVLQSVGHHFHLGSGGLAVVSSAAVVGMVAGGLVAGILGDRYGRRRLLIADVALLVIGSLGAGLAPSFAILVAARVIGGVAVGASYTIAFVYLAEIAPPNRRGKWMAATLWGANIGFMVAYGAGALLLDVGWGWRFILALGGILALPLLGFRRLLPETAAFTAAAKTRQPGDLLRSLALSQLRGRVLPMLAWFSYQVSDQGLGLFLPLILAALVVHTAVGGSAVALGVKAVTIPASFATVFIIDRFGPRRLQIVGFGLRAIFLGIVAALAAFSTHPNVAVVVVGLILALAAGSAGPDKTTVIIPATLGPTRSRATSQGVSQVAGRLGGIVGPSAFVLLDTGVSVWAGIAFFAFFAIVGTVASWMLPKFGAMELPATIPPQ
ncbi:MAG: MFS transporter [Ferrimicrobium sp.]